MNIYIFVIFFACFVFPNFGTMYLYCFYNRFSKLCLFYNYIQVCLLSWQNIVLPCSQLYAILKLLYAVFKNGLYEWMNECMHEWMYIAFTMCQEQFLSLWEYINSLPTLKDFFYYRLQNKTVRIIIFNIMNISCHILFSYKKELAIIKMLQNILYIHEKNKSVRKERLKSSAIP